MEASIRDYWLTPSHCVNCKVLVANWQLVSSASMEMEHCSFCKRSSGSRKQFQRLFSSTAARNSANWELWRLEYIPFWETKTSRPRTNSTTTCTCSSFKFCGLLQQPLYVLQLRSLHSLHVPPLRSVMITWFARVSISKKCYKTPSPTFPRTFLDNT